MAHSMRMYSLGQVLCRRAQDQRDSLTGINQKLGHVEQLVNALSAVMSAADASTEGSTASLTEALDGLASLTQVELERSCELLSRCAESFAASLEQANLDFLWMAWRMLSKHATSQAWPAAEVKTCLLYQSDAADDRLHVGHVCLPRTN